MERNEALEREDLYDLEIDEVSFVDRGDNEGARVLLWKRRHDAVERRAAELLESSGVRPSPTVSAAALQEMARHVAKQSLISETNGGLMTTQTMNKAADVVAAVQKQAEERMLERPELTPAGARVEVWYENPDLRERYERLRIEEAQVMTEAVKHQGGGMMLAPTEEVAKAQATVLQKHQAAAQEIRKANPRISQAEARKLAWEIHPALRAEYNATHGAA